MRHRANVVHFGRKSGPRKALLRGLVNSLVEHERIETTLIKAKELRRHVEKAITVGKAGSIHARRLLTARYPNDSVVKKIVDVLSVRFKDRAGGYTQVLKTGARAGDNAPMAIIQFVGYDVKTSKPAPPDEKALKKMKNVQAAKVDKARKVRRKIQNKSRAVSRLKNA